MADKKLSSVSAVNDMNYVYAETSSGETVKISKADLASVVAGVIGVAGSGNDGLASTALVRGTTAKSTTSPIQIDFDDYTGQSIAIVNGPNSPTGNTTRYYLLVQKEDIGRMKMQTAQDYETGLIYSRTYTSKKGEWSPWVLNNFGYNSLAELAGGVLNELPIASSSGNGLMSQVLASLFQIKYEYSSAGSTKINIGRKRGPIWAFSVSLSGYQTVAFIAKDSGVDFLGSSFGNSILRDNITASLVDGNVEVTAKTESGSGFVNLYVFYIGA